jgi:hypothetical protein
VQSFSGPNPTWRARSPYLYSPGTGWPGYTPGTGFPFRRLLRLAGLRWRYSTPSPHGVYIQEDSRFSERWLWRVLSPEVYRRVVRWKSTDVWRNTSHQSSGSEYKPSKQPAWKQVASRALPSRLFFAWLIIRRPWRWRLYVPPKRWLAFNGLHDVQNGIQIGDILKHIQISSESSLFN